MLDDVLQGLVKKEFIVVVKALSIFIAAFILQGCTAIGLVGDANLCEKHREMSRTPDEVECALLLTYVGAAIDMSIMKAIKEGGQPRNPMDPHIELRPFTSYSSASNSSIDSFDID